MLIVAYEVNILGMYILVMIFLFYYYYNIFDFITTEHLYSQSYIQIRYKSDIKSFYPHNILTRVVKHVDVDILILVLSSIICLRLIRNIFDGFLVYILI